MIRKLCRNEFYETHFSKKKKTKRANEKLRQKLEVFLSHINSPKLTEDKVKLFQKDLPEKIYAIL